MAEIATVRELSALHPEIKIYDYKWGDFPDEGEDLVRVLAERGYRLADEDADIAGEYNDIKAYYGCRLVPLDE